MSTIVYLHGFASSGYSPKSQALIDRFGVDSVYHPDLPIDPDETIKVVSNIVKNAKSFPIVFVGTSLGGFWAHYFAHKYDAKCVLINPSVSPDITMQKRVNQPVKHYKTNEDIIVTNHMVNRFAELRNECDLLYNGKLVNVFLAKDDDVIDYKDSVTYFKYNNSMTITEDGGHRYNQYWDNVIDKIEDIING
jgi:predicted esterase YcpF (UPF0227 family)